MILAAGMGTRLRPLTNTVPKCLVPLGGRPLIDQALWSLRAAGVERAVVVCGYRADAVAQEIARFSAINGDFPVGCAHNPDYATTGTAASLLAGLAALEAADWDGDVVMAEGDIWFDQELIGLLLASDGADAVAVDKRGVGGDGSLLRLGQDGVVEGWYFLSTGIEPPDGELHRLGNVYRFVRVTWRTELLPRLSEATKQSPRLPLESFLGDAGQVGGLRLRGISVGACRWWEVDTEADLAAAEARCVRGLPADEAAAIGRNCGQAMNDARSWDGKRLD